MRVYRNTTSHSSAVLKRIVMLLAHGLYEIPSTEAEILLREKLPEEEGAMT